MVRAVHHLETLDLALESVTGTFSPLQLSVFSMWKDPKGGVWLAVNQTDSSPPPSPPPQHQARLYFPVCLAFRYGQEMVFQWNVSKMLGVSYRPRHVKEAGVLFPHSPVPHCLLNAGDSEMLEETKAQDKRNPGL